MKRKLIFISVLCTLLLLLLPACDAKNAGSLKSITRPYIAQYECTSATFGGDDVLKKFDYIEINLVNKKDMEIIYKPKGSDRKIIKTTYSLNTETREMTAEVGIYGYSFKETTKIQNGKFTISKAIGRKQLIMNFQMK
ncbi:MAG: hypothetical protein K2K28_02655 [Clostridia bacterium]|nr:hypothetical protein [Clostridia bacterium]